MSTPWSMDVTVESHSWTVTDLDPATPGPAAPLQIRRALPDDQLWPSQPLPDAASFSLIATDAAALSDVVEGADVHLVFTAPPNPATVTFDGTVADVDIEQARFKPDPATPAVDGVRVTVTAIGYLAQLMEEPITLTEDDFGSVTGAPDRFSMLFEATPWSEPDWPETESIHVAGNFFGYHLMTFKALAVDGEALGPHLDRLLRLWLWKLSADGPIRRLVVAPNLNASTRNLKSPNAWVLQWADGAVTLPPGAVLAETPDGWGVVPAGTLDAGHVERGARFVQRKRTNVSRVVVPYFDMTVAGGKLRSTSVSNGNSPTVLHTIDSDLALSSSDELPEAADDIATFYLPAAHADKWGVDTLTWHMYRDEPGSLPPDLGELVVVAPVPESTNPNGRSWVTGLVRSWTLTLPDPVVELELITARGIATPDVAGDRMTWAELPATPTWDDLRSDHTWDDYDLLGGP